MGDPEKRFNKDQRKICAFDFEGLGTSDLVDFVKALTVPSFNDATL